MSENALVPYRDILEMAQAVVKGRLFPDVDTPEKALTLMLLCQSEGLHPMQALTRYHIIKGRPALKADAMLAAFMERGGTVKWKEWTNEACEAIFTSAGCPDGVVVRWTMADARARSAQRRTKCGARKRGRIRSIARRAAWRDFLDS